MDYTEEIQAAAAHIVTEMRQIAAGIESAGGPAAGTVFNDLARAVRGLKGTAKPGALDGRTQAWRVRLQIFGPDGSLEADSDPEVGDLQAPGETIIYGLREVGDWAREAATAFHASRGETIAEGLDESYVRHKAQSLRPTLSRNAGAATWRLPYKVGELDWLMYVPIRREPVPS